MTEFELPKDVLDNLESLTSLTESADEEECWENWNNCDAEWEYELHKVIEFDRWIEDDDGFLEKEYIFKHSYNPNDFIRITISYEYTDREYWSGKIDRIAYKVELCEVETKTIKRIIKPDGTITEEEKISKTTEWINI